MQFYYVLDKGNFFVVNEQMKKKIQKISCYFQKWTRLEQTLIKLFSSSSFFFSILTISGIFWFKGQFLVTQTLLQKLN